MVILQESAFAKINLTLDVLNKRPDGYHDLKSVMQTISLQDDVEITVDTGKSWCLHCDKAGVPEDERNLAWKAAKVFYEQTGLNTSGIEIRITKRIPAEAGLGGGSADAGAVLRALNRHYGSPLSSMALADLGALVGSDVPFCTLCGTAMAEGRGERLRKLPDMPACWLVVCKPEFSSSTPALYRKLDETQILQRPNHAEMENALLTGDLGKLAENIYNVFDPVVTAEHPELNQIKAICDRWGAIAGQMTGSGSAVFAIMPDRSSAEALCDHLRSHYQQVFVAQPV